jgi:hypothetical protein
VRLGLVLLALALIGTSCGGGEEPPEELTGAIVAVQAQPEGGIDFFTLEADGETYTIYIADDVNYGFDLAHLHEHQATREPVRCTLEERGERLYALEIVDAVPS